MIFRQVDEILNGTKTQTRRVVKPGEALRTISSIPGANPGILTPQEYLNGDYITTITASLINGRVKRQCNRPYKIVPKRGQPGLTTHKYIIRAIRVEPLAMISAEDALAEGLLLSSNMDVEPSAGHYNSYWWYEGNRYAGHTVKSPHHALVSGYRKLWESINKKAPYRWQDNPLVWVYTFKVVEV